MDLRNILIVNNDPIYALQLKELLSGLGYTVVGHVNTYQKILDFISINYVDLLIIDIMLDNAPIGLELTEALTLQNLPIILLTNQDSSEVYQKVATFSHILYLVKPFHIHTLDSIIRMLAQHPTQEPQFIQGNSRGDFIAIKDILFLEVEHTYTFIQTTARRYAFKKSLTQLKSLLPTNRFLQVHRSFLVNKKFIGKIDIEKNIVEIGGYTLPLSRRMKHELLSKGAIKNLLT
ncbi:LytR/AlgR family response regulator transcription factor [Runella aurantiaca]|uniref:DNA-binding response regulator n=1 Tax=Runella aurantiaca TaxID=2282308 RepID=A0A369IG44_9BACT|nr:LytTR family DNA-binding domain-containing protein [Runella aurantiaca]RDB08032.1 DNA-binding response regulator [Runella aurantiaca]